MMTSFYDLLDKIPSSLYCKDPDSDLVKLFKLYSDEFDELKRVSDDLAILKEIKTQKGDVLDELGKILKEPRSGMTDEEYRRFLYKAIQKNISSGSLKSVIQMADILTERHYKIREMYSVVEDQLLDGQIFLNGKRLLASTTPNPATVEISLSDQEQKIDEATFFNVMKEIKPAGVAIVNPRDTDA
jgi:hypothetical protein